MDIPEDLIEPQFIPYAVAVGELCNSWSKLEGGIRMLFLNASGMKPNRKSFGIVHTMGVRDLMAAVKICIVENPNQALQVSAISCLDYIDSALRPRRNRHVHDPWFYSDQTEVMNRVDYTPKIAKQPLRYIVADWTDCESPADVWALVREVRTNTDLLKTMQDALNGDVTAAQALHEAPLRRLYRPPPQGTPSQKGSGKKAPRPPPRS